MGAGLWTAFFVASFGDYSETRISCCHQAHGQSSSFSAIALAGCVSALIPFAPVRGGAHHACEFLMHLSLDMPRQPTDVSCGPTCLHAIYRFFGADSELEQLIADVPSLEDGGTLSVHLALHALQRGFSARIISYNVRIFDPSWWNLESPALIAKLNERIGHLKSKKLAKSHRAYVEFLEQGGELDFFDLNPESLKRLLAQGSPILTGLSATYLYREPRQNKHDKDDDVAGNPVGHFVVITGWREKDQEVVVSDPFGRNPFNPLGEYRVNVHRFINSVMLGIVTYDANLLVISPRPDSAGTL